MDIDYSELAKKVFKMCVKHKCTFYDVERLVRYIDACNRRQFGECLFVEPFALEKAEDKCEESGGT